MDDNKLRELDAQITSAMQNDGLPLSLDDRRLEYARRLLAAADAEAVPVAEVSGSVPPTRSAMVFPLGDVCLLQGMKLYARPQHADVGVLVETLAMTIEHLSSFVAHAPHGDNCFVSDHYEGDPGNRCNCGKDSAGSAAISGLEAIAEWEAK